MASNKLAKLDHPLPLRNYDGKSLDQILETEFKFWLAKILNISAENEKAVDNALPAIKKHCWSMGLREVKQMFEMYVDGELDLQPKSGYFDRVLVGQIHNSWKNQLRTKPKKINPDEEKAMNDYLFCVSMYDHWVQTKKIYEGSEWVYDYLEPIGLYTHTNKQKIWAYNRGREQKLSHEDAINAGKRYMLNRFFRELKEQGKHIKDILKK